MAAAGRCGGRADRVATPMPLQSDPNDRLLDRREPYARTDRSAGRSRRVASPSDRVARASQIVVFWRASRPGSCFDSWLQFWRSVLVPRPCRGR